MNFSFSGVKTSILYFLQNATRKESDFIRQNLADLCASIQHRIVEILLKKLRLAALETGIREVCLSGGVSANRGLRDAFMALGEKQGWKTYVPRFEYCTDNAAMIAITGYHRFQAGRFEELDTQSSARGH